MLTQEQREERRQRILKIAAKMMLDSGTNVPMSDIAREGGVSVGGLYLIFPEGKTGLLRELVGQDILDESANLIYEELVKAAEDFGVR